MLFRSHVHTQPDVPRDDDDLSRRDVVEELGVARVSAAVRVGGDAVLRHRARGAVLA